MVASLQTADYSHHPQPPQAVHTVAWETQRRTPGSPGRAGPSPPGPGSGSNSSGGHPSGHQGTPPIQTGPPGDSARCRAGRPLRVAAGWRTPGAPHQQTDDPACLQPSYCSPTIRNRRPPHRREGYGRISGNLLRSHISNSAAGPGGRAANSPSRPCACNQNLPSRCSRHRQPRRVHQGGPSSHQSQQTRKSPRTRWPPHRTLAEGENPACPTLGIRLHGHWAHWHTP